MGCWLVQSGRARDGNEALEAVARLWEGVEKRKRYPLSPETGAQAEYVRKFQRVNESMCSKIEAGMAKWVDEEEESE